MYHILSNPIHPKVDSIQAPSLLDINPIDTVEGIDDSLSAVGEDGVAETLGDDLDGHAGFDADAVHTLKSGRWQAATPYYPISFYTQLSASSP